MTGSGIRLIIGRLLSFNNDAMSQGTCDVVFTGRLDDSRPAEEISENLQKLLKSNPSQVDMFFSGNRIVIKHNTDRDTAERYVHTLEKAGVFCIIQEGNERKQAGGAVKEKLSAQIGAIDPQVVDLKQTASIPAFHPKTCNRITGWTYGVVLHEPQELHILFEKILAVAVYTDSTAPKSEYHLLMFVKGFSRPFLAEASKIKFSDFTHVTVPSLADSLRKFMIFLCMKKLHLIIDRKTFDFIHGKPAVYFDGDVLKIASSLGQVVSPSERGREVGNETPEDLETLEMEAPQPPLEKGQKVPLSSCAECGHVAYATHDPLVAKQFCPSHRSKPERSQAIDTIKSSDKVANVMSAAPKRTLSLQLIVYGLILAIMVGVSIWGWTIYKKKTVISKKDRAVTRIYQLEETLTFNVSDKQEIETSLTALNDFIDEARNILDFMDKNQPYFPDTLAVEWDGIILAVTKNMSMFVDALFDERRKILQNGTRLHNNPYLNQEMIHAVLKMNELERGTYMTMVMMGIQGQSQPPAPIKIHGYTVNDIVFELNKRFKYSLLWCKTPTQKSAALKSLQKQTGTSK